MIRGGIFEVEGCSSDILDSVIALIVGLNESENKRFKIDLLSEINSTELTRYARGSEVLSLVTVQLLS